MDANEKLILSHRARYLLALIRNKAFPPGYLVDEVFTNAISDLQSDQDNAFLAESQENLEEELPSRHWRRRRGGGLQNTGGKSDRLAQQMLNRLDAALEKATKATIAKRNGLPALEAKIREVSRIFELDAQEQEIFRLIAFASVDGLLYEVLDDNSLILMRRDMPRFVSILTGLNRNQVQTRISHDSRLRKMGIIEERDVMPSGHSFIQPTELILKVLASQKVKPDRIIESFYTPEPEPELNPEDFEHLAGDLAITMSLLQEAWQTRRKGINILLHGGPGLGKTQFARLAGIQAEGSVFSVLRKDEDDGDTVKSSQRRMAYDIFQRLCQGETRPLLVVDEAESMLADEFSFGMFLGGRRMRPGSEDTKAWLTQALVENPIPVIWLVNDTEGIHPAVRRRFSFALRFPEMTPEVKARVWMQHLEGLGKRFAIPQDELVKMITTYELSPALVAQGLQTWKAATGSRKPATEVLHHVLERLQEFNQGKRPVAKLREVDSHYDPALLHLDGDLDADRLERSVKLFYEKRKQNAKDAPKQLTYLFHGPSGAGKTELAKYLARQAGCNLQVERMSDLLSMWVGESEKNMANAFRKAAAQGSILLLDEFDSLAYDRNKAQRSWEVSQTNELLQQIENYPGVLIASTNLVDSLDQAISRRFTHKIGFAGLRKEVRTQAVTDYFRDWLGFAELDQREQVRLEMMPGLYPGDLRAVRQRFASDVLLGDTPAPEALIAALEHEASFRKTDNKPIGFRG